MTLKEKFQKITYWWRQADELEKIADDFAVNFANWSWGKILITINEIDLFEYRFNVYTSKELLEIYKKEKGL